MNFWFELKYAMRLARKSWGYSLMCIGVVALSAGLAAWTSEVAYSQILKPLGFPNSERWYSVQIAADKAAVARPAVDAYTYQELLKQNRSADYLGAFANRNVVLSEGQASNSLRGGIISPRLFAAFGTAPQLGRTFAATDGQTGTAPVAVISHETWQNYFAGDRGIVGKTTRIDSVPVQIVGVMPKDFFALQDFEVWLPLQMPQLATPAASTMTLTPLIVLGENQDLNAIRRDMKTAVDRVNSEYPSLFNAGRNVQVIPALRMYTHFQTPILVMVGFMCAAVLVVGAVNISLLFLARLLERRRELAVRTAVGASRSRLLRQCLLEAFLVLPLGLLGGYGLAVLIFRWGAGLMEFGSRILGEGRGAQSAAVLRPIDMIVAAVAAIVIWLLSTLLPAWRIARQDPALVLAGSGKGNAGSGGNRSATLLVGLEVVISCVVLVACACLVLAVKNELGKPTGVNTSNLMLTTFRTDLGTRYAEPAQRVRYWEDLTAAIGSRLPNAQVAYVTAPPTRPTRIPAAIETQEGTARQGALRLPVAAVSDNYFEMMGIRLRSGRLFDSTDNIDALKVAVVDEKLAERYWPDQNVIGKRVQLNPSENGTWLTIVGVVAAVEGRPYGADPGAIYQSLRQAAPAEFMLLARVPNASADSRTALRAAAFAVDRDLPLRNLQMFDDYLMALNLNWSSLIPAFIVVALLTALMAAFGLFGLISRSVALRTQEVGIRRALGATPWRATSIFMRQGARYLIGALVGIALGVMVANLLSGTITNVLDYVLLATAGVVLLMAAVIFTASYLPSRRAVALEPGDALRYE